MCHQTSLIAINSTDDKIVLVQAGIRDNPGKIFEIRSALLSHFSSHFRQQLDAGLRDLKVPTLRLECPVQVVEGLKSWLDTGRIHTHHDMVLSSRGFEAWGSSTMVAIWVVGERYGIPWLQNDVVNCVVERFLADRQLPVSFIVNAYRHLPRGSLLRRFALALVLATQEDLSILVVDFKRSMGGGEVPAELRDELLRLGGDPAMQLRIVLTPLNFACAFNRCDYHVREMPNDTPRRA